MVEKLCNFVNVLTNHTNIIAVAAFGRRKRTTNCIFDALRDFEAETRESEQCVLFTVLFTLSLLKIMSRCIGNLHDCPYMPKIMPIN